MRRNIMYLGVTIVLCQLLLITAIPPLYIPFNPGWTLSNPVLRASRNQGQLGNPFQNLPLNNNFVQQNPANQGQSGSNQLQNPGFGNNPNQQNSGNQGQSGNQPQNQGFGNNPAQQNSGSQNQGQWGIENPSLDSVSNVQRQGNQVSFRFINKRGGEQCQCQCGPPQFFGFFRGADASGIGK